MKKKVRTELVRVGSLLAEVEVTLPETEGGWSPYLSVEDAYRLDAVRDALGSGDVAKAATPGKVYTLTPVDG